MSKLAVTDAIHETVVQLSTKILTKENRQKQDRLHELSAKSRPSAADLSEIDDIKKLIQQKINLAIEEVLLNAFNKVSLVDQANLHKKLSIIFHPDRAMSGAYEVKLLAAYLDDFDAKNEIQRALNRLKEQNFKSTAFAKSSPLIPHTTYEELPFTFEDVLEGYNNSLLFYCLTLEYFWRNIQPYEAQINRYTYLTELGVDVEAIRLGLYAILVTPVLTFELLAYTAFNAEKQLLDNLIDFITQGHLSKQMKQYETNPDSFAQTEEDYIEKVKRRLILEGIDSDKLSTKTLIIEELIKKKTMEFASKNLPLDPVKIRIEVGNEWVDGKHAFLLGRIHGFIRLNIAAQAFYRELSTPLQPDFFGILNSLAIKCLQSILALVLLPTIALAELARVTYALLCIGLVIATLGAALACNGLLQLPLLAYDALVPFFNKASKVLGEFLAGVANATSCGCSEQPKSSTEQTQTSSSIFSFFSSAFSCGDEHTKSARPAPDVSTPPPARY